jgi:hypothetical protein
MVVDNVDYILEMTKMDRVEMRLMLNSFGQHESRRTIDIFRVIGARRPVKLEIFSQVDTLVRGISWYAKRLITIL